MKTHIFLTAGSILLASGGMVMAAPCADRIADLSKQLSRTDAGSGPTTAGAPTNQGGTVSSTGTVQASPPEVPKAGQTPKTGVTPAISAMTENRATSPADVRAQIQGQPSTSQAAQSGGSTKQTDSMQRAMAALDRARALDRAGKEDECMSAIQEAERLSGK